MIKNIKMLLLVGLAFAACTTKEDEVIAPINSSDGLPLTAGSANFSKYVAVGNSLSAGFSDGALFMEGQKTSWTAILADQFKLVGGGNFKIPFMADNVGGFLTATGTQNFGFLPRLYFNTLAQPSPAPELVPMMSSAANSTILTGGFNNMGVPGAKVFHLLFPGYGNLNPYFGRFATSPGASILADAKAQDATFFSLWIGNNDVLAYATNCGEGVNRLGNPDVTQYGLTDLTDPTAFAGSYSTIVNEMTAKGAKGIVANIPDVTSLPYFYVVKYNQLTQSNLTVDGVNLVNQLNTSLYGPLSGALQFLGQGSRISLLSTTGNNPMLMIDENLTDLSAQLTQVITGGLVQQGVDPAIAAAQGGALGAIFGKARQTKPTDLIGLNAASRIGRAVNSAQDGVSSPVPTLNKLGVSFPLPDRYVLMPEEIPEITAATLAFNTSIKSIADAKGLAFVDANKVLNDVNKPAGLSSNGFTVKSTYVTGGAFSLDGVHPSPRGYALIANEFIKVINAKYGSNLKGVDLGAYRVLFPKNL